MLTSKTHFNPQIIVESKPKLHFHNKVNGIRSSYLASSQKEEVTQLVQYTITMFTFSEVKTSKKALIIQFGKLIYKA